MRPNALATLDEGDSRPVDKAGGQNIPLITFLPGKHGLSSSHTF